ncbi:hypothetical protein WJX72_003912 [[Myrmecia] bisecta]|uniref:Uncharacterized protein n=1 Tax=[Myrmecia] bisecta TaxID=41462 RepID=A0AAW1PU07_9CHLO
MRVENSDADGDDLEPLIVAVERAGEAAKRSQERTARRLRELADLRDQHMPLAACSMPLQQASRAEQADPPGCSPDTGGEGRPSSQLDSRRMSDAQELASTPGGRAGGAVGCSDAELAAARSAEQQQLQELSAKKNALEAKLQQLTFNLSLSDDGGPSAKKARKQTIDKVWEWLNGNMFQEPPDENGALGHAASDLSMPSMPSRTASLAAQLAQANGAGEALGIGMALPLANGSAERPQDASTAAEHAPQASRKLKRKSMDQSSAEVLHGQAQAALQAAQAQLAQHPAS